MMIFHATRLLLCGFSSFIRDRRGNIGVMTALLIVPLVGAVGMATEASGWFLVNRAEQSAADSAALAAATNNDAANGGAGYISEGKAVAAKYGFADGANNTTVSILYQPVASVPSCVSPANCYVVTVTHNLPLFLSGFVGYSGNVALGSGRGQSIAATAVAIQKNATVNYCVLSLATAGDTIRFNGTPDIDFAGCTLRGNGSVRCDSGRDGGATDMVYGPGSSDKNCSPSQEGIADLSDPYANSYGNIPGNIPTDTCKSYSTETKKGASSLPKSNLITQLGGIPAGAICGDAALSGDVTISGANNVLVIDNGVLDLNGHTLTTTGAGAGLTVVFTGNDPKGSYSHYPAGNGTLNIAAPTSGTWSGVVIWQDKSLPSGNDLNVSYSGNNPTWELTGLVYLPGADVKISGAVNKSGNGFSCFALVDNTLLVSGTGSIFANSQSQCTQAGLNPPQGIGLAGAELVF